MTTTLDNQIQILNRVSHYRDCDGLIQFNTFHTIGIPLAYCYIYGYVDNLNDKAVKQINDTWTDLLDLLGIEDSGFDNPADFDFDYLQPFREAMREKTGW